MHLQKIRNVFTSKFVRTGPSSYKKRIYRAAVSQRLRNTGLRQIHLTCASSDILKNASCTLRGQSAES